ncbi:nickel-responsive transcriptional regulator NikR [Candidatus Sulfidibacterium hydrothermale]|uniref:nickel-responsive transcriptional regulator NikR n=1 Tax=Candidatus Sulfidibacterium hydrothermale TaxID=2875962 RepID=UPI001F0B0EAD|nr:nickel-responsive transcriptional regulator NikR [Candidatus Sulfidibacterium hydrothermale]UBM63214.1 nickel-responsive transcriptional regulator NikR [Candidatus Sulfidibacterium hydrothermale]
MHVSRFSISVEKELLDKLDDITTGLNFPNRSRTIRHLIQKASVQKSHAENKVMAGAVILIYNHHQRDLQAHSTDIQHQFHHLILSVQHVHLDHNNCLETIAVKGKADELDKLAHSLISLKGIQYGTLAITGSL